MSVRARNTSGILERVAGYNDTDLVLSATSKNPIANKTVYAALQQKIEKTVNDLVNYYVKSDVYNKTEVRELIGAINTLTIEVVSTLPTQDISTTTIYFVGPAAGTNTYDEYVYVNSAWVKIGDTAIDLSGYVTTTALTTALQSYYTKPDVDGLLADYYDKDEVDDLLDLKQNTLEFDDTPISGSPNPVTSAGIKTALDNILITGNGGSIIKVHHTAGAAAAGNTVTASKGSYSVSSTFDVDGNAIIIGFGEIGTVTLTATNGSETGETTINIPSFSSYSATISYGLDYKSWLIAGNLSPSYYSSLDEVLADEEAVRKLMTLHDSVDYLASAISSTDPLLVTVLNNDICAKWITLRSYALDTLHANQYCTSIMDTADKYDYGEWLLIPQVPKMYADTAPYGVASSSGVYGTNTEAYRAFDWDSSYIWMADNPGSNSAWIQYKFPYATQINHVRMTTHSAGNYIPNQFTLQGSDDGSSWTNIQTVTTGLTVDSTKDFTIDNNTAYLYYRVGNIVTSAAYVQIKDLQFYGWGPKGNIPVMTSNTVPYGVVSASGTAASNFPAYNAFCGFDLTAQWRSGEASGSWIMYKFINPVCAKRVAHVNRSSIFRAGSFKLQGSNDGTTFTDLVTFTETENGTPYFDDVPNDNYYLYYRVFTVSGNMSDGYTQFQMIQIYGREMDVYVPVMTSDTAPYGEAFASSCNPHATLNYAAHSGFDGHTNDTSNTTTDAPWHAYHDSVADTQYSHDQWLAYDFGRPVLIKECSLLPFYNSASGDGLRVKNFKYQGSNDKLNWTSLTEFISTDGQTIHNKFYITNLTSTTPYRYYRVFVDQAWNVNYKPAITYLQFYGYDYSEYDWDSTSPRHYIYDHGIEFEQLDSNAMTQYSNSALPFRNVCDLDLHAESDATNCNFSTRDSINNTNGDYSHAFYNVCQLRKGGAFIRIFSQKGSYTPSSSHLLASASIAVPILNTLTAISIANIRQSIYPTLSAESMRWFNVDEWWLE